MDRRMKRIIRISAVSAGSVLLLLLVGTAVVLNFVFTPSKLTPVVERIADRSLNARLRMGGVELTFFSTFPRFGVKLTDGTLVSTALRDTLWQRTDTLLTFRKAVLVFNPVSYLRHRKIDILKLSLDSADVYAFRDGTGRANWDILPSADTLASGTATDTTADTVRTVSEISVRHVVRRPRNEGFRQHPGCRVEAEGPARGGTLHAGARFPEPEHPFLARRRTAGQSRGHPSARLRRTGPGAAHAHAARRPARYQRYGAGPDGNRAARHGGGRGAASRPALRVARSLAGDRAAHDPGERAEARGGRRRRRGAHQRCGEGPLWKAGASARHARRRDKGRFGPLCRNALRGGCAGCPSRGTGRSHAPRAVVLQSGDFPLQGCAYRYSGRCRGEEPAGRSARLVPYEVRGGLDGPGADFPVAGRGLPFRKAGGRAADELPSFGAQEPRPRAYPGPGTGGHGQPGAPGYGPEVRIHEQRLALVRRGRPPGRRSRDTARLSPLAAALLLDGAAGGDGPDDEPPGHDPYRPHGVHDDAQPAEGRRGRLPESFLRSGHGDRPSATREARSRETEGGARARSRHAVLPRRGFPDGNGPGRNRRDGREAARFGVDTRRDRRIQPSGGLHAAVRPADPHGEDLRDGGEPRRHAAEPCASDAPT